MSVLWVMVEGIGGIDECDLPDLRNKGALCCCADERCELRTVRTWRWRLFPEEVSVCHVLGNIGSVHGCVNVCICTKKK